MLDPKGLARLELAIKYGVTQTHAPYDEDAPVRDDLDTNALASIDPRDLELGWEHALSMRARVRYLAALFPDATMRDLVSTISGIVASHHLSDADIRLILSGRSLADPSKMTREVPIEKIQFIGGCLRRGMARAATARLVGVSLDTVETIDAYLGLSEAHYQKQLAKACDAVRDGISVRAFAARIGVPSSTAYRLLNRAREVLMELGEVAA